MQNIEFELVVNYQWGEPQWVVYEKTIQRYKSGWDAHPKLRMLKFLTLFLAPLIAAILILFMLNRIVDTFLPPVPIVLSSFLTILIAIYGVEIARMHFQRSLLKEYFRKKFLALTGKPYTAILSPHGCKFESDKHSLFYSWKNNTAIIQVVDDHLCIGFENFTFIIPKAPFDRPLTLVSAQLENWKSSQQVND